ncbi:uncharacterized protein N7515_000347 [Penicillium bovifimosum]|uniref:F-box domain-containing protein n=1 Tax=Penicillium bovifimosum TaxID=126998 RepID=A0A9W9HFJ7_9EURO|nr:uncharacterized protein N7515_000347 [Penicillium bovifimosum]KAJ5145783.1 hypothetical protein N7515_000347 [Penicillium bovifimosum]
MARLLDLPNEVILEIIDYLQTDTKQIELPFYKLGDAHRYVIDHNPSQRVKYLHSLLLASRRLNSLLTPIFYRDIFVREYGRVGEKIPLEQLKWTLEKNSSLEEHIVSAIIPCGSSWRDRSIRDVFHVFWFTNIQSLTIHWFKDWEPMQFEDNSHVGTSPVECLRLIDCGAHEEALATVLSWPAALKVLHYDADQGEWDGHYGDEPAKSWTCAAFVRTLRSQRRTLEELTMTRPWLEHEGLGNGPRIDLSEFTAIQTLRIYHVFLCGWDDPTGVWKVLPPNLEVLEVFYDDRDLTQFLWEGDEEQYDTFLLDLIRNKRAHLPHLRTVTIYSFDQVYDPEREEELPAGLWTLPSSLAREAEAAGIKLDVWLGYPDEPNFEEADIFGSLKISQNERSKKRAAARLSSVPQCDFSQEPSTGRVKAYGPYTQLQF